MISVLMIKGAEEFLKYLDNDIALLSESFTAIGAQVDTVDGNKFSVLARLGEIIDELEKEPRGIYGGALGYIDFSGNLDTCIAIRMAVKKNGKVYVQAGGGIVADSKPRMEYEESANKAKAVMLAIENAKEALQP